MARIEGVSKSQAGPIVKLVYRFGPRMMRKMTGRDPQVGSGIEPIEIWAYQPKMMIGMGRFNQAVRKVKIFGIGSAGFSEGTVCVPPDRPATTALVSGVFS